MEAYKERMIEEYVELKKKYNKLHRLLTKIEAETLEFEPTCPAEILRKQKFHMGMYLNILEIRAEIEGIGYDHLVQRAEVDTKE